MIIGIDKECMPMVDTIIIIYHFRLLGYDVVVMITLVYFWVVGCCFCNLYVLLYECMNVLEDTSIFVYMVLCSIVLLFYCIQ